MIKKLFFAFLSFVLSNQAFSFSECTGYIRLDNNLPDEQRVVESFSFYTQDAVFGFSNVSLMKMGKGPQLEAVRYENCKTPWPEDSLLETICEFPKTINFKNFPAFIGVRRQGNHSQEGEVEVYFLAKQSFEGDPIAMTNCTAF